VRVNAVVCVQYEHTVNAVITGYGASGKVQINIGPGWVTVYDISPTKINL